jgi:CBS domain-containing protein
MRCSEIMKTDIECVAPQTSVRDAARKMRDEGIGFLPVCDEAMRPVGTLTDRDIAVRAVAGELSLSSPVEACMTREVVDCRPSADIEDARELMEEHRVSRIICTGLTGRVEGIISLSDIVDQDEESGAKTLRQVSRREVRGDSQSSPRYVAPGL